MCLIVRLKNNGINYLKILSIVSILSLILGLIIILFYYTFSSTLKKQYYNFKNNFSEGNEYLAVVNDNGLWLKEDVDLESNIIHAEGFNKNKIENITITKIINNSYDIKTIIAKEADIKKKIWKLYDVKLISENGLNQRIDHLNYQSNFSGEIISNLFSNLNSLNIYELHNLKKNYSKMNLN